MSTDKTGVNTNRTGVNTDKAGINTNKTGVNISEWSALDDAQRAVFLARPALSNNEEIRDAVRRIIAQVRADGDSTLRALTRRFDGIEVADFAVSAAEFAAAERIVPDEIKHALDAAIKRIEKFHRAAMLADVRIETAPGVICERIQRPIENVGLYVPAGSAPLPSTAIMLGVPARLAGCPQVILCTPPTRDGGCDPVVLVAAARCGIDRVFKIGGAQAIAAMAFGSESIPKCDKIFGPGNAYVTQAKLEVAQDPLGAAIDMPAGPSEVLVIADDSANVEFVAADLLAQAEHGPDSQVLLLTPSRAVLDAVAAALDRQCALLPRAAIATTALQYSRLILVKDLAQACGISNSYAPEHLILNVREPRRWLAEISSAGSIFLGAWSPESVGDYCSGTNHVLPTYGYARAWSGVSVASFQKQITVQELSPAGLRAIGPDAATLARCEGLNGHERAVTVRLKALEQTA